MALYIFSKDTINGRSEYATTTNPEDIGFAQPRAADEVANIVLQLEGTTETYVATIDEESGVLVPLVQVKAHRVGHTLFLRSEPDGIEVNNLKELPTFAEFTKKWGDPYGAALARLS